MNTTKPTITVFTPTYNRAYCLHQGYEALTRQTCKDFMWLVVDDGSTDNTHELVEKWQKEADFIIKYIYQENGGMVAAHNTAHYHINTLLNVCIDSDDYMPDDAVEKILNFWNKHGGEEYMGIVGLDAYKDGSIVGSMLPNIKDCNYSEIRTKYKVKGDKKYVLRTDLIKSVLPYPKIENEQFPSTEYLYLLLKQKYNFLILNEVLCTVEYMPDGMSKNIIKSYRRNPSAFAVYRIAKMQYASNYNERIRHTVHYISSLLLARKYSFFKNNPYKLTTLLALPVGFFLFLYIKSTKQTAVNKKLNKG